MVSFVTKGCEAHLLLHAHGVATPLPAQVGAWISSQIRNVARTRARVVRTLGAVPIEFNGSPSTTLGIELELGLVDRETRALTSASNEVLEELERLHRDADGRPDRGHDGDPHSDGRVASAHGREHHDRARHDDEQLEHKVKHELFQCTVEVITGICRTVADARCDLDRSLRELRQVTDPRGLELIGSGSHPFSSWREQEVSPEHRYLQLIDSIQWPARRMAIHGVHFHVGVPSGEHSIAVVQSLAYHLPLLLAGSASSPYWLGRDTGMASSRTKVFEGLPTAGLPPRLSGWSEFESLMDGLLRANVISSIREIWWDCRPHPDFGTVELRMCDGIASMEEVSALAAVAQSLVTELIGRFDAGEPLPGAPEWVVRENKWLASRYGLDASFIVDGQGNRRPAEDLFLELVARLQPTADRIGCRRELDTAADIVERGPSYRRQRRIVAQGGGLDDVVDALATEHRSGLR